MNCFRCNDWPCECGQTLLLGDCLDILPQLLPGSVHCVVTSPPYWGLRDYGIPGRTWGGEPTCGHSWGNTVAVNATNHTDKRRWNHTRNGRDEEQPVEKRVAWKRQVIEQGQFCQNCGAWFGALGLEPTPDLYCDHVVNIFAAVRGVLREDGTVWLNLGDTYNAYNAGVGPGGWPGQERRDSARPLLESGYGLRTKSLKPKDLVGIPWRVAMALQEDGWYLRQDIIWHKPNPMPESVKDRCTKAHEYIFLLSKSERYHFDAEAIAEPAAYAGCDRGGSTNRYEQNSAGMDNKQFDTRNKRSVWSVNPRPYKAAHFATFPPDLIKPCILAGCPEGGVVLDPFVGSGTTSMVAMESHCKSIGIELNPDYIQLAKNRLHQEVLPFGT